MTMRWTARRLIAHPGMRGLPDGRWWRAAEGQGGRRLGGERESARRRDEGRERKGRTNQAKVRNEWKSRETMAMRGRKGGYCAIEAENRRDIRGREGVGGEGEEEGCEGERVEVACAILVLPAGLPLSPSGTLCVWDCLPPCRLLSVEMRTRVRHCCAGSLFLISIRTITPPRLTRAGIMIPARIRAGRLRQGLAADVSRCMYVYVCVCVRMCVATEREKEKRDETCQKGRRKHGLLARPLARSRGNCRE